MCQTYKYRYICSHIQIESTPCDYRDSGVGSWLFRRVCSKFSSFSYIRALCPSCRKAVKQQVRFTEAESKAVGTAVDEVLEIIVRNERFLARCRSNKKAASASQNSISFATPFPRELEHQHLINSEFLARRESRRLFHAVNCGKASYDDFLDEHYYHAHLKSLIEIFDSQVQHSDQGTQTNDDDILFSVHPTIVHSEGYRDIVREWESLDRQLKNNWPEEDGELTLMNALPQDSLASAAGDPDTHHLSHHESDPEDTAEYEKSLRDIREENWRRLRELHREDWKEYHD